MERGGWPALPLEAWRDTRTTLHLWTQVAGKIRMGLSPKLNHWWNVTLYVNSRGLTTAAIPFGDGAFEIQFDFLEHRLEIASSDGQRRALALEPQTVASFYGKVMDTLRSMGIEVAIDTKPQEVADPIPFEHDDRHTAYDREYARRFWRVLLGSAGALEEFRSRFIGKCSPVHFFWGSFDLACTRFSGRRAPPRPGVITSEAYSHECSSAGFWPGGDAAEAAYYAYTAPKPEGLESEAVRPAEAFWSTQLSEFLLPYEAVRQAESPREMLLEFFESTYEAGAKLAKWDRASLERR